MEGIGAFGAFDAIGDLVFMKFKTAGFTLVEMLLVSGLVALIGVVIFSAFGNGLKLWARGIAVNHDADTALFMMRMKEDLRSMATITGINFEGSEFKVSFPSVVTVRADKYASSAQEQMVDQIGAVQYWFDPVKKAVLRRQANYGQALKGQWGPEIEVATSLDAVEFRYFLFEENQYRRVQELKDKIPSWLSIEARAEGSADQSSKRIVLIPIGG